MRTWSERNGRTDVTVHGFTLLDNLIVIAAGLIILVACIFVIGGLS